MQFIFEYILKLSISLAVVYLFYIIALRRLTFYHWNRWYLLFYSVICFYIPFINISALLNISKEETVLTMLPSVDFSQLKNINPSSIQHHPAGYTMLQIVPLILAAGALILAARLLIQYISFLKIKKSAELINSNGVKIYRVKKDIIPFSIGNSIFLNDNFEKETDFREVIRHEFVHVKQKHSIDILFTEFLCIINWYNPFAWMIRHAVRQNLEFIADNNVLQNGFDKKQYQYLLLKVIGVSQFSIAQQFNFSSLKKRIVMMNKLKSAKLHLIKFLFVLPLAAALLLAFRDKQVASKKALQLSNAALVISDTVPTPPPPPPPAPPQVKALPENVQAVSVKNLLATVTLKDGTIEKYDLNSKMQKAAYEKKYGTLPPPPPPPPVPGTPPPPPPPMPAEDKSNSALTNTNNPAPLIVVDEKKMPDATVQSLDINPNDIQSINVLKDKVAVAKYGDLAKNGVIEINTKAHAISNIKTSVDVKTVNGIQIVPVTANVPAITRVSVKGQKIAPVVATDIKLAEVNPVNEIAVVGYATPAKPKAPSELKEVTVQGHKIAGIPIPPTPPSTPGDIKEVVVQGYKTVKDEPKEVVVLGYAKKKNDITEVSADALYIIDGKESTKADLDKLPPNSIESVNVLKGAIAEKEYGDKGKNGVIKITTKKKIS